MNGQDDKQAFEQLLLRNRGRLTAIAHAYADGDADDLLQQILLQIWRAWNGFQRRSSIDTWCYRVALNTAISWRRANRRRQERLPAQSVDMDQLVGASDASDATDLLHQFMQTLSDVDRALMLMYLEDMSGSEMAEAIGISVGAIRVRIHRIKQRLVNWKAGDA